MVAARRWHLVDLAASPEVTAGRKHTPAIGVRPLAKNSGHNDDDDMNSDAVAVLAMHSLYLQPCQQPCSRCASNRANSHAVPLLATFPTAMQSLCPCISLIRCVFRGESPLEIHKNNVKLQNLAKLAKLLTEFL